MCVCTFLCVYISMYHNATQAYCSRENSSNIHWFHDLPMLCVDAVESTLCNLHRLIVKACTLDLSNQILWQRANVSLLNAGTTWAFLGELCCLCLMLFAHLFGLWLVCCLANHLSICGKELLNPAGWSKTFEPWSDVIMAS